MGECFWRNHKAQGEGSCGAESVGIGYSMGAYQPTAQRGVIESISFISEALTVAAAALSSPRGYGAGVSNVVDGFGYMIGGLRSFTDHDKIEKLDLNTEVLSTVVDTISVPLSYNGGVNSKTNGYSYGGWDAGLTKQDAIEKLSFAADVASPILGVLSVGTSHYSSTGMSAYDDLYDSGFTLSGWRATTGITNACEKIAFATDSISVASGTIDSNRWGVIGGQDVHYGYAMGGRNGALFYKTVEKFNFSTETFLSLGDVLFAGVAVGAGVSSSTKTYTMGGGNSSFGQTDTVEGVLFDTDTLVIVAAVLSGEKLGPVGVSSPG